MAVNESRSMNRDLLLGITDGKFKSLTPERGGEVDPTYPTMRADVLNLQYNIVDRTPLADAPNPVWNRRR
jgi:hypothetical protein